MKLNEKIITLRNKYQMSQGDLAEKLNVSRQSVSKWETGASTPDLDKLIAMSELFHVTMDELVKEQVVLGKVEEPVETKRDVEQRAEIQIRDKENMLAVKVIGVILVLLTPFMIILALLGFFPFGSFKDTIFAYLFICGLICIFSRKNVGRRILIMTLSIVALIMVGVVLAIAISLGIS